MNYINRVTKGLGGYFGVCQGFEAVQRNVSVGAGSCRRAEGVKGAGTGFNVNSRSKAVFEKPQHSVVLDELLETDGMRRERRLRLSANQGVAVYWDAEICRQFESKGGEFKTYLMQMKPVALYCLMTSSRQWVDVSYRAFQAEGDVKEHFSALLKHAMDIKPLFGLEAIFTCATILNELSEDAASSFLKIFRFSVGLDMLEYLKSLVEDTDQLELALIDPIVCKYMDRMQCWDAFLLFLVFKLPNGIQALKDMEASDQESLMWINASDPKFRNEFLRRVGYPEAVKALTKLDFFNYRKMRTILFDNGWMCELFSDFPAESQIRKYFSPEEYCDVAAYSKVAADALIVYVKLCEQRETSQPTVVHKLLSVDQIKAYADGVSVGDNMTIREYEEELRRGLSLVRKGLEKPLVVSKEELDAERKAYVSDNNNVFVKKNLTPHERQTLLTTIMLILVNNIPNWLYGDWHGIFDRICYDRVG